MLEITGTILITHNAFFGALFATANNLVTIGRQKYKLLADTFLILFTFSLVSHWSTKKSEREVAAWFIVGLGHALTALSYGPLLSALACQRMKSINSARRFSRDVLTTILV
jgi:hypothetical protein